MTGFNPTSFFNGTWYVTHVKDKTSASVCQTFTTSTQDGKYKVEYKYNNGGQEYTVTCLTDQGGSPKLTFSCTRGESSTFQAEFTIMDTDYNDYAVFYRCVTFTSGSKADNYLVLRRDNSKKEIPAQAKSLTDPLDLKTCELTRTFVL
uniref:Lipocalin/cytosolic fatty-acid binding domain-containing protein n=1 Tax=Triatoma rubida TaxID=162364 RepID=G8JKD8_9HEMI